MLKGIKKISNPLTVIAVFAGLIEIVGTVMLPQVSEANQIFVLIFLLAFPCLLVILFFLTLNFNHKVLYAPSDFTNDANFLAAMDRQLSEVEERISQNVEKEITEKVSAIEDSLSQKEVLMQIRSLIKLEHYNDALTEVDKLLDSRVTAEALHLKAMILARKLDFKRAIDLCTQGLDLRDNGSSITATLYWNRACYKCHNQTSLSSILEDLEEAILQKLEFSEKLLTDEDLSSIRNEPKFEELVSRFHDELK
jgi:hypothetical protein